jgi:TRAP-type C4-dicarboxylate transport system substrate-binding protein
MKKIPDFVKDKESAAKVGGLSEEVLDTTDDFGIKLSSVSRRDFMRISKQFGLTATYAAVAGMGGVFSADALAQTVNTKYQKKFGKKAKHVLRQGSVFRWEHTKVQRVGIWEFCADIEERSDGEIRIEILPGNSICAEPVCIQKTLQGVLDIGTASTQNASGIVPWLNVLDYPYMFQSAGQIYHFLFNPKSEKLFRKVYRDKYKLEFLWSLCEMRQLFMGLKWKNKPPITSVGMIAGTKNRVTNTQLGRIAMQLMKLNPVPVAWVETLDAMKSGLIDGMETWTSANTAFNMAPVTSQYVGLKFIPGTEHTAIRTQTLDKLGSRLTDLVMESAFQAQARVMYNNEAGLITVSGETPNPAPDSIFGKYGVVMNFFSDAALKEAEDMANPTRPEYNTWHEKLDKIGGYNTYEEMKATVRQYPKDKLAIDVEPRRWWLSA